MGGPPYLKPLFYKWQKEINEIAHKKHRTRISICFLVIKNCDSNCVPNGRLPMVIGFSFGNCASFYDFFFFYSAFECLYSTISIIWSTDQVFTFVCTNFLFDFFCALMVIVTFGSLGFALNIIRSFMLPSISFSVVPSFQTIFDLFDRSF